MSKAPPVSRYPDTQSVPALTLSPIPVEEPDANTNTETDEDEDESVVTDLDVDEMYSDSTVTCTRCFNSGEEICVHRTKVLSLHPPSSFSSPSPASSSSPPYRTPPKFTSNPSLTPPNSIANSSPCTTPQPLPKPYTSTSTSTSPTSQPQSQPQYQVQERAEFTYHTPLPTIPKETLNLKVQSLLAAEKESHRFAIPLPGPGYGRESLKPLATIYRWKNL